MTALAAMLTLALSPYAALWLYGLWSMGTAVGNQIGRALYRLALRRVRSRREIRRHVRDYLRTHAEARP